MAVILRYFTELVCDAIVKQLPRFQNPLLIVLDHIKTICAIIQRLFGQNKLITRFDGRMDALGNTQPVEASKRVGNVVRASKSGNGARGSVKHRL